MTRVDSLLHQVRINGRVRSRFRPYIEPLEDRWLPSVLTVTSTADSGPGTLRADLAAAQNGDTIIFALPNPSTIQLTSGTLNITSSISIAGPGSSALTVKGNATFPIFNVASTDTISGLTISGGGFGSPQGNQNGGGIFNTGTLNLSSCAITGNSAGAFGTEFGSGGGIYNAGIMTVNGCVISGNRCNSDGGGIAAASNATTTVTASTISSNTAVGLFLVRGTSPAFGGGISNSGSMLVQNTVMTGNNAGSGDGGAISNSGPLTIVDCTIASNTASSNIGSSGGGIDSGGVTTIRDSTIANNAATGLPPPVHLGGAGSGAGGGIAISQSFTLSNCTIFGNSATGGDSGSGFQPGDGEGGGLAITLSSGQTGLIANCTIAGNHANGGQGSGGVNGNGMGGGIVLGTAGTTNLDNTIVATNAASTADGHRRQC